MDIERERGITIKSQAVALTYTAKDGEAYHSTLSTRPATSISPTRFRGPSLRAKGRFSHRCCARRRGPDPLQHVHGLEHDLEIIPVINKIDLPSADPDEISARSSATSASIPRRPPRARPRRAPASTSSSRRSSTRIPPPRHRGRPPSGPHFRLHYDPFRGIVVTSASSAAPLVPGERSGSCTTAPTTQSRRRAVSHRWPRPTDLSSGSSATSSPGSRPITDVRIGDTITHAANPAVLSRSPASSEVKPVVFSSIYPMDAADYDEFKVALEKLQAQRRLLIYEKDPPRPGLGIPMRVSRPAASRGRAGEARARIRPGDHPDRAERAVPLYLTTGERSSGQSLVLSGPGQDRRREEPYIKAQIITP